MSAPATKINIVGDQAAVEEVIRVDVVAHPAFVMQMIGVVATLTGESASR